MIYLMENYCNDETGPARAEEIARNLDDVRARIEAAARRAGRSPDDVTLMAVTKTKPASDVNAALAHGVGVIGENRVQELLSKLPDIRLSGQKVHIIGHLQTNKVHQIIDKVDMIQSVDSVHLAEEIEKQAAKHEKVQDVLIEVNIGGEAAKSGVAPSKLRDLLTAADKLPHVHVCGLMTVPPRCENKEDVRPYFSAMRKLFIDIASEKSDNRNMQILSMGMSGDFETAVEEGSTMVRVGTSIFGKR